MQGNLAEMSLVDLIQVNCLEKRRARLTVRRDGHEATLFFDGGEIVHAHNGSAEGRDALFELLTWPEGDFELQRDVAAPARSLEDTWSGLLLEGMRRIDEGLITPPPDTRSETRKTTGARLPSPTELVERLESIQGIAGALVVAANGTVLAHRMHPAAGATEVAAPDPERLAAITVFVSAAADRLAQPLGLGGFVRGVVTLPAGRLLVKQLAAGTGGACAGLLLEDRASPDLMRPAIERALSQPGTERLETAGRTA